MAFNTAGTDTTEVDEPAGVNVFAAELKRRRDVRGYSRAALVRTMDYDRSYVSKVETGSERFSKEFAGHAETALRAGGALRSATTRPLIPPGCCPGRTLPGAASLIVDHDDVTLRYDAEQHLYQLTHTAA